MLMQTKIPVVMRRTISQYTDIRDELEDFRDFIQDICYDISEVVEEINDQLDDLYDRLITYNELAEKYGILPEMRSLVQTSPVSDSADEEKLPFPADEEDIV